MRRTLTVYLKVVKLNIPRHKINKLLRVPGALQPKDSAKITQFLARIEVVEARILHIKSIAEKLARKSFDSL